MGKLASKARPLETETKARNRETLAGKPTGRVVVKNKFPWKWESYKLPIMEKSLDISRPTSKVSGAHYV